MTKDQGRRVTIYILGKLFERGTKALAPNLFIQVKIIFIRSSLQSFAKSAFMNITSDLYVLNFYTRDDDSNKNYDFLTGYLASAIMVTSRHVLLYKL